MSRPRFDEHGLGPAYAAIALGTVLIAALRTATWFIARADHHVCAFANDTHMEVDDA